MTTSIVKKVLPFIMILTSIISLKAQAPQSINYQAIARNDLGDIIANDNLNLRFSIHEATPTGTIVYSEEHAVTTDQFGLINLGIGEGTNPTGSFSTIPWADETYHVEVKMDYPAGSGFVSLGTSKFRGVPYDLDSSNAVCCMSGNGDFNGDSIINFDDLLEFLAIYGGNTVVAEEIAKEADMDGDCHVGRMDFTIFMAHYGDTLPLSDKQQTISQLLWSFGPTEIGVFYVDSSVGIGTTAPQAKLHIEGTPGIDGIMFPDGTLQTTAFTGPPTSSLWSTNSAGIHYDSGKVGIGVVNPESMLSVGGIGDEKYAGYFAGEYTAANVGEFTAGVYATSPTPTGGGSHAIGVRGFVESGNGWTYGGMFGARSDTPSNTGRSFGIKAEGGNATPGYNYGVYGQVTAGSNAGAGIVGHDLNHSWGGNTNGFWAGYFHGDVHISHNVGIGTHTPAYKLQVGTSGDGTEARANTWSTFSDRRWKTNFQKIDSPLDKLSAINGYYYHWKDKEDKSRQVGVIAQEIEAVLPGIVSTDDGGYKSVDYSKLTALLIEAVKAQQTQIETLTTENQTLKSQMSEVAELRAMIMAMQDEIGMNK